MRGVVEVPGEMSPEGLTDASGVLECHQGHHHNGPDIDQALTVQAPYTDFTQPLR